MLALPGLAIAPVFFGLVLWQQAMRQEYTPLRQPISALVHGTRGWLQSVNFAITGLLVVIFAVILGLTSHLDAYLWSPVLIFGLALIGCCIVPTDITGLEDAERLRGSRPAYGLVHDGLALVGCVALYVGCFIAAAWPDRWPSLWSLYSAATGIIGLGSIVAAGAGFTGRHRYGGLLQRIAVGSGLVWLLCLALRQIGY